MNIELIDKKITSYQIMLQFFIPVLIYRKSLDPYMFVLYSTAAYIIEYFFVVSKQQITNLKLTLMFLADISLSNYNIYVQIMLIPIIALLLVLTIIKPKLQLALVIVYMSFNLLWFFLQKTYNKIISIQNIKVLMMLILINHSNFYSLMLYLSCYQAIILSKSKFQFLQFNLQNMPLQYQQSLKIIIQLKQCDCLQMKHKIINYLQLLLQQPITSIPEQTKKDLLNLQKYVLKKQTNQPDLELLDFIYSAQYYIYRQIAKPTYYQKYIIQLRDQFQLYDPVQMKNIQHILLADLIVYDILNQEIIQERMAKQRMMEQLYEDYNEPQFIVPQTEKKKVLGLIKNSSTGMILDDEQPAEPGTAEPEAGQQSSQNQNANKEVDRSKLCEVDPKYVMYFSNKYPNQLNISNEPNYYHLTESQLILKDMLDQTYQQWYSNRPSSKLSEYMCENFETLNFDCVEFFNICEGKPLLTALYLITRRLKLDEALALNMTNFIKFLEDLELSYNKSLYHNKIHATDVLQITYLLISQDKKNINVKNYASQIDQFALILSAACHDIGHTGMDNMFLHKYQTGLHYIFPEIGPYEQVHASLGFSLIMEHNFIEEDLKALRIKFIEFILTTDMTSHFQFCDRMKQIDAKMLKNVYDGKIDDPEIINQIRWWRFKVIIKLADISNPCRAFHLAEYWAYSYINECRSIGQKIGTPMNPSQDCKVNSVANSQIFFIGTLLKPFMDQVERLSDSKAAFELLMCQNMQNTYKQWEARRDANWVPK